MSPTDDETLIELRRELHQRERVFPRWVADGRLTQADADKRFARLKRAIEIVEAEIAKGRLL